MLYVAKARIVDALRYKGGENFIDILRFSDGRAYLKDGNLFIKSFGVPDLRVDNGDYILKDNEDNISVMSFSRFHRTYERYKK